MSDFELKLGQKDEQDIEYDINYWLAQPNDQSQKPQRHIECNSKSDCSEIINTFYSKKHVKIAVLSGTYIGIDYTSWMRLCRFCKLSIMEWYFGEVFVTEPTDRPSKDLFELEIETDNAANDWDSAYNEYQRMIADFHENDDTIITKEELEEMKVCCEGHKLDWKNAYGRLQNKLMNLEFKSSSSKGVKITNQDARRNNDTKSRNEIKL